MAYVIVSGYSGDQRELLALWHENTLRYASPKRIFIVNGGATPFPLGDSQWINFSENLQHVDNSFKKLCGWTMSFLTACFAAYHENADLIYKEQDCFAFGPWVEQMYKDLGDKQVVMGQKNTQPQCKGLRANSLVLIKHDFLLEFIQAYLMFADDDKKLVPEHKFDRLLQLNPKLIGELSFGYDRSPPAGYDYLNDRVFYIQKLRPADIELYRSRGLIGKPLVKNSAEVVLQASSGFNRAKRCRHGFMVYNVNDLYVGRSLDLYGEFSEGEIDLFKKIIRPNDVVLDVGANIGAHTLFLAQAVAPAGGVIAFEPQRILHQTLCANMALNSVFNAFCLNMAVGESGGTIMLPELDPRAQTNFGGIGIKSDAGGSPVGIMRLDDLPLASCRMIKIDVEGMEAGVLKGARNMIQKFRPILYVENDRDEKSAELIALVRSMGYELYWHHPPLFSPENFFGNKENVFGEVISENMLCLPREMEQSLGNGLTRVM